MNLPVCGNYFEGYIAFKKLLSIKFFSLLNLEELIYADHYYHPKYIGMVKINWAIINGEKK